MVMTIDGKLLHDVRINKFVAVTNAEEKNMLYRQLA